MKNIAKKIWRAGPVVAAVAVVLAAVPAWAGGINPPVMDAISVPEPGTLGLLATGIAVAAYLRYRK